MKKAPFSPEKGHKVVSKRYRTALQILGGFAANPSTSDDGVDLPKLVGSAYKWADELIKQENLP